MRRRKEFIWAKTALTHRIFFYLWAWTPLPTPPLPHYSPTSIPGQVLHKQIPNCFNYKAINSLLDCKCCPQIAVRNAAAGQATEHDGELSATESSNTEQAEQGTSIALQAMFSYSDSMGAEWERAEPPTSHRGANRTRRTIVPHHPQEEKLWCVGENGKWGEISELTEVSTEQILWQHVMKHRV